MIAIKTGQIITEVGSENEWRRFFEMLESHLGNTAVDCPVLYKNLQKGKIRLRDMDKALNEVKTLRADSVEISALKTVHGLNLLDDLADALTFCIDKKLDLQVIEYNDPVNYVFHKGTSNNYQQS